MDKKLKYSISGTLSRQIDVIAQEFETSPGDLLEWVVGEYVKRRMSSGPDEQERRSFLRRDIDIPAIIYAEEDGGATVQYQPAVIKDVSPGGIRVAFKGGNLCGRLASKYNSRFEFEIVFAVSGEVKPIRLRCLAQRVELIVDLLHIGARIISIENDGQKIFQKILEERLF